MAIRGRSAGPSPGYGLIRGSRKNGAKSRAFTACPQSVEGFPACRAGISRARASAVATDQRSTGTSVGTARRAGGDESSRDRAVNQETFLRNEFGVRTFGYTSFVIDPPNGQMPAITRTMGMEVY